MIKLLMVLAAVMLFASSASAQGINMFWNDCSLGSPSVNLDDACDSDFGLYKLVASLVPQGVISDVVGLEAVIDIAADNPTVPDYWAMEPGGCREGLFGVEATTGIINPPFNCHHGWTPSSVVSAGLFTPDQVSGANRTRLKIIVAVPQSSPMEFDTTTFPEYYLFTVNFSKLNTTSCSGCSIPACLVLNQVLLAKPVGTPGGDLVLTMAATSQHVTWQGGGSLPCPGATSAQSRTWGQVKSLYR